MHKTRLRPQGFTLMELFITVFVLVSIFGAFVTLFYALNKYSKRSYNLLAASDVAYAKLQAYEQKRYSDVAVGSGMDNYKAEDFSSDLSESIGPERAGSVFVTPVGDNPNLKKVDVIVSYKDGGETRTVHYATILHPMGGR